MTILTHFNNIEWYLKRPKLYPELFRLVSAKLIRRSYHPSNSGESMQWCKERAIDTQEAIQHLTGSRMPMTVREKYQKVFFDGEKLSQYCPFTFGGPGNLDLLYWISEFIQALKVVETGVAYGWSSLAFLLSLTNRENARLISTDMPYRVADDKGKEISTDAYVGCVVPNAYKKHWLIIRQADREALPKALHRFGLIDMCHYDSDKTYNGRMWAYPKLWQALRIGGYFISDDISDNFAFRDFCLDLGSKPMIVRTPDNSMGNNDSGIKYVGILIKKD